MSDAEGFPLRDPVGPAHPELVVPGTAVIADVVAAQAAQADATGVPRSTIDALADAGLLGSPLTPPAAQRELGELLAGSDASTWFCWVQHFTPLRILEAAAVEHSLLPGHELLAGMRSGQILSAVAFAHVRRPGPANPVATRVPGGWRIDGTLDWVTSWDIADVVMVMAQGSGADEDSLVCCFLPAGNAAEGMRGVEAGAPLELLAMGGTHTRPVRLAAVDVPGHRVGAVLDRRAWLAKDAITTADASPSAFGVARGAIAELDAIAEQRSDELIRELVRSLVEDCRSIRHRAYAAIDEADVPVERRLGLRADSLDLVLRATAAVVIARAGAAMRSGQSAERRAREALFLQVQAQTAASRRASLRLLKAR